MPRHTSTGALNPFIGGFAFGRNARAGVEDTKTKMRDAFLRVTGPVEPPQVGDVVPAVDPAQRTMCRVHGECVGAGTHGCRACLVRTRA